MKLWNKLRFQYEDYFDFVRLVHLTSLNHKPYINISHKRLSSHERGWRGRILGYASKT